MLWWISQSLVGALLLAGVVWVVCHATRIGPAARHALWLVVLIKLLTPPMVVWPWGVSDLLAKFDRSSVHDPLDATPIETLAPIAPPPVYADDSITATAAPAESTKIPPDVVEVRQPEVQTSAPVRAPSEKLLHIGAVVWLAGACAFALLQTVRVVGISRRLRGANAPNAEVIERMNLLSERLHMRPIGARVVPGIGSPFVWTLIRPVLVWPAELPASMPRAAMDGLIVHELAHVKRRDHWVGWLELAAGCVWWWNPLYWYVRHQLRENAELACDAWVVGTLPAGRRAYAEALLTVCEGVSRFSKPLPAVGLSAGGRHAFERRLKMIALGQTPFRLSTGGLVAALVIGATALPAWSQLSRNEGTWVPQGIIPTSEFGANIDPALPEAARKLFREYQAREVVLRREAERQLAVRRLALIRELKTLQDRYASEGLLDEAVAVRAQIRSLQPQTIVSDSPYDGPRDLTVYRGQEGMRIVLKLVGDIEGPVWGSNPYTDDSSVAAAAVHAGVLKPGESGVVRITILAGAAGYDGSTRNGVASSSYGEWAGSFQIDVPPTSNTWTSTQPDPGTLTEFRNRVGKTLAFRVTGSTDGTVWGSDVFTDDSSLATAAVHAGLLNPGEVGTVRATIMPGLQRYEGSTQNGVTTHSYGPWEGSFRFNEGRRAKPQAAAQSSEGTQSFDAPIRQWQYAPMTEPLSRRAVGESFQVVVTGSTHEAVWGTDVYTDDSSIAAAAVHAGVLKDGEHGLVLVTMVDGQPEYEGSTRNGVASREWGQWDGSFRVDAVEKILPPVDLREVDLQGIDPR